jgi:hypothetical protein
MIDRSCCSLRRLSWILTLLVVLPGILCAGKSDVPLKPDNARPVHVTTGKSQRTYYRLDRDSVLRVTAEGPSVLTVFSRMVPPAGGKGGAVRYTVTVSSGKGVLKKHGTEAGVSSARAGKDQSRLGAVRKMTLKLPEGRHDLRIRLEGSQAPAALVRLTLKPLGGKLIALEPLSYARVARLCGGEKPASYYVAEGRQPVRIRAVGPVLLKVTARCAMDSAAKPPKGAMLIVREGNREKNKLGLASKRATSVRFCDWRGKVPGTPSEHLLSVPEGEHTFELAPADPKSPPVALRFSIPEGALKNKK